MNKSIHDTIDFISTKNQCCVYSTDAFDSVPCKQTRPACKANLLCSWKYFDIFGFWLLASQYLQKIKFSQRQERKKEINLGCYKPNLLWDQFEMTFRSSILKTRFFFFFLSFSTWFFRMKQRALCPYKTNVGYWMHEKKNLFFFFFPCIAAIGIAYSTT